MSERAKPGNVMKNLGNMVEAQKKTLEENVSAEEVKSKIGKASTMPDEFLKPKKTDKDKMVFKGFQYSDKSVAKVEAFLPIINVKVRQSPIVFEEELNLAQTIIQEKDVLMDTLGLLYKHIVEGPVEMTKDFESFMKHLHEADMEPLLYGFYLNSYGPEIEPDEEVQCIHCGGKHKIDKVNLLDIYEEVPFEGEAFESLKVVKELDLNDCDTPAVFYLKFSTMDSYDQNKNISKSNFLNDIANSSLSEYVQKFTFGDQEFSDKDSIKNAIGTLNVKSRKKFKAFIEENFSKYGIKFIYKWTCKNEVPDPDAIKEGSKKPCNKENERRYRMNELFFRQISESIS